MHRIFIVEDDAAIAAALQKHLTTWGFDVRCAEDFRNVLAECTAFDPQLVLLDITLPFYNGYHWCQELRRVSNVPVVFLSSASDNMNIVMAMNMGGDDFIAKPFDLNVLLAKIQAILRRTYDFAAPAPTLEHRGAVLNTADASLTYQGQRIELTKNDYRILQTLLERKGSVVSRETLMEKLWETDSFVDENTLTVNIARLRRKLEAAACRIISRQKRPRLSHRVRGQDMFGAYVKENRKVVIALAVYTAVFALIFWLYRLPLGAVGYAALVCLFLLLVWFAVDYRRFAVRLRLLRRLEQEITLSTEQLPEPDGALEAQYQALVRALDADRRAQMTRSQRSYQDLVEYYTVWAHQIKTPIAAMRLLLQDADTDEQRALLEQLQSVEQYVEMVLGYLRLESPSSDYVIRNYALDDIVRQAVRKFASQFIRRKLRLEYTPLNVSVITDEKWLLFVIEQVLSNALKYTRSGSVSITLEAPKTLCIRDTGIGIAPEDLPRVFEKGYTGSNGRTDKRATGIGLYLCRRILAKLGHSITIVSTPGEGTTVRIGLEQDALEVE